MKTQCALIQAFLLGVVALHAQDPAITNQPAGRALWAGGNVTFTVGVSGTGPFAYQWQLNGTNLPNDIITTVAGTGSGGAFVYTNGVAAIKASLVFPKGVVSDDAGNFFILDHGEYRIRKVDTNGIISTIAGIGTPSYSGDGGPATNAAIDANDIGILLDKSGNIIFADLGNYRIRKIDTNDIITTIAGNGSVGYSGDGGPATNAMFNDPYDVAMDNAGNLFIADVNNYRIRKVDTNGIIWTVAGNGTNGYSGDGGMATNAMLSSCLGITIDGDGNLFISDNPNSRIRKVDTNGIITTVAGTGVGGFSGDGGRRKCHACSSRHQGGQNGQSFLFRPSDLPHSRSGHQQYHLNGGWNWSKSWNMRLFGRRRRGNKRKIISSIQRGSGQRRQRIYSRYKQPPGAQSDKHPGADFGSKRCFQH